MQQRHIHQHNQLGSINSTTCNIFGSTDGTCILYDAFGREVERGVNGVYTGIMYTPVGKTAIMNINLTTGATTTASAYFPLPGGATYYQTGTANGSGYFWHKDWLGSVRLSSSLGSRAYFSDRAFAPFAEKYDNFGNTANLNFTGDTQDSFTGLFDTPNRELSSAQGRWISPDPAGLRAVDPSNPQTWNRYAYVANNPNLYIDPLGLWRFPCSNPGGEGCWDPAGNGVNFGDNWNVFATIPIAPLSGAIWDGPICWNCTYVQVGVLQTQGGGGNQTPANNLQPWQRRASVVAILRAKNGCSGWFNTGTGSAADIMTQVRILNIAPPGNPDIPGPDAQTSPDPISPIDVYTNGRFWPNSANGLPVGGMFPPGSPGAQTIILLHELAHKTGLIPSDGFSPAQSDQNTQTVTGQCAAAINQ